MGVTARIRAIPEPVLQSLVERPRLGYAIFRASFLSPRRDAYTGELRFPDSPPQVRHRQQLLAELRQEAAADPATADLLPILFADRATPTLDLEKSWHCLHFILCGSAKATDSPLGRAVLGHECVLPDVDLRMGFLSSSEVAAIAAELRIADFTRLELESRGGQVDDVYRWSSEPKECLRDTFSRVQEHYTHAAGENRAMVMWRG